MRHRATPSTSTTTAVTGGGTTTVEDDPGMVVTSASSGRHRAPGEALIPRQLQRERFLHEPAPEAAPEKTEAVADEPVAATPVAATDIPPKARWRASHLPRSLAASMLVAACLGTTTLAVRYAEVRGADNAIALAIGVGVIVGLWALLIASTPQVVLLSGSILTVRNSRGVEQFDLADGLQPVDIVAEPTSSKWALLLHRADCSSVVLRRRDVDAVVLDRVVRHYRRIALRAELDRRARFDR
jgi:hypothetical protein